MQLRRARGTVTEMVAPQGTADSLLQALVAPCGSIVRRKKEEKGTGARGAPVPVVGRRLKVKRYELRSLESRPDEARVNSR